MAPVLDILPERAEQNKDFEVDDLLPWLEKWSRGSRQRECWEPRLLIKEFGDVAWYLAEAATALDVPLETVFQGNLDQAASAFSRRVWRRGFGESQEGRSVNVGFREKVLAIIDKELWAYWEYGLFESRNKHL